MTSLLYQAYGIEWTTVIQKEIAEWVDRAFGAQCRWSRKERAMRVLEEAIELAQSSGITMLECDALSEHVYDRPVGEIRQEAAGVAVTLLAFAEAHHMNLAEVTDEEVKRVLGKDLDELRRKHNQKKAAGISIGGTEPRG